VPFQPWDHRRALNLIAYRHSARVLLAIPSASIWSGDAELALQASEGWALRALDAASLSQIATAGRKQAVTDLSAPVANRGAARRDPARPDLISAAIRSAGTRILVTGAGARIVRNS